MITAKLPYILYPLNVDNKGYVSYNVTFQHLIRYVDSLKIDAEPFSDEMEYGLGSFYPTPGGLMENVRWLLGEDTFIREIGGEKRLYDYLRANAETIAAGNSPFLLYDALNCENGCICGTAVDPDVSGEDRALCNLLSIREDVKSDNDGAWVAYVAVGPASKGKAEVG